MTAPNFDMIPKLDLLLDTGIFNRYWYTAQADKYFTDVRTAAVDFLEHGMAKSMSPHPLMDVRFWPKHLQEAWRRGELHSALGWFRRHPDEQPPAGPLFMARLLNLPPGLVSKHPGGSIGWYVENAADDQEMDTPAGTLRFGDVRASWGSIIDTLRKQTYLTRPRIKGDWDHGKESDWRREVAGVELPKVRDAPLVTVVMPAWNRSGMIASAIRSVQHQSLKDWELVVVDDGSNDSTADVVRTMAVVDSRIVLLEIDHVGVSGARNKGLRQARGRWVAFLDTDNTWSEDYLELTVRGLLHTGARAVHSGLELHNGGSVSYRAHPGGLDSLMVVNHIDLNVFAMERGLGLEAGGFDPELRRWVDHDFAIRVAKIAEPQLLPFVGCKYWDERSADSRITTSESEAWQWAALGKNWVVWDGDKKQPPVPGRVTVSMPVFQDWSMTVRAVSKVLENSGEVDVEVIVVDNGSAYYFSAALAQFYFNHPRVTYVRLPRNMNYAIGSNYGASLGTGEFVCFLNNDTEVRAGWLYPLIRRMEEAGVLAAQPLLQYPDDSIQTAGTVFMASNTLPGHFLTGLPPEDASEVGSEVFSAITGACMLWRRVDIVKLQGFDPLFVNGMEDVDLCLRAIRELGGHFVVEPASKVTHLESKTPGRGKNIQQNRQEFMRRWNNLLPAPQNDTYERHGWRIAHVGGDGALIPSPRPLVIRNDSQPERWGIRYAATGGSKGDRWGDYHYVTSLAASLRRNGVEVVTYRHGHNLDRSMVFDNVNLVVRGLDKVMPIPGAVNVLWIISHPEDVTSEEIYAYDLVFASSIPWCREMTERLGVPVRPLLQATDTELFHLPVDTSGTHRRPTTFVGANTYNRNRVVVRDALEAGVDLRLIGHGWETIAQPPILEADSIDNGVLGDYYRSSKRVLADHWPAMAEMGFIQNRVYDAAACGTPVISDSVKGLGEVFGSIVQTYETPDELRFLCSEEGLSRFGTQEELRQQARRIAEEHSFEARARSLIASVAEIRSSDK